MTTENPANPYPSSRHGADIHLTARRDDIRTVRDLGGAVDSAYRRMLSERVPYGGAHRDLEIAVERLVSWDNETIDVARCSPASRSMVAIWRRDGRLPVRGDR